MDQTSVHIAMAIRPPPCSKRETATTNASMHQASTSLMAAQAMAT